MLARIKTTKDLALIHWAVTKTTLWVETANKQLEVSIEDLEFEDPNGRDLIEQANHWYGLCEFPMLPNAQIWPVPQERRALWVYQLNRFVAEAEKARQLRAWEEEQITAARLRQSIEKAEYDARFPTREQRIARKAGVLAELALLPFSSGSIADREAKLERELEWLKDVDADVTVVVPVSTAHRDLAVVATVGAL